ncbi:MAG: hypothetical protein GF418_16760 [Chitinivibrionales bacterium]|nr:hypothetical protein [Chitinivibrionales bacterium]MBD3397273.1 hypothetical protein [Chitinivibrionales bacterium]
MNKIILFRHIVKTAGSTFKFVLANSFGLSFCNSMMVKTSAFDSRYLNLAKRLFPRLRAIGGHNVTLDAAFRTDRFFRVTFLREPVSRTISEYQHAIGRTTDVPKAVDSFPQWLNNTSTPNQQTRKVARREDLDEAKYRLENIYDFVGLTEQFDASLRILSRMAPHQLDIDYARKQTSEQVTVGEEIRKTRKHVEAIRAANELDRALYDYAREHLFEKYKVRFLRRDTPYPRRIHTKYTPNSLLSMWYNKLVFRMLFRNYAP